MNEHNEAAELPPRLAEASPEDRARALAKGARVLARMRPGEGLRGHTRRENDDEQLRRVVVRLAVSDEREALESLCAAVGAETDGARALLRAMGNLRRLHTRPTCLLADVLVEALSARLDKVQLTKCMARVCKALGAAPEGAEDSVSALVDTALRLLDGSHPACERVEAETAAEEESVRTWLLQELCALELRVEADSDTLARVRAPLCPKTLEPETKERLQQTANDSESDWSARLAAWWILSHADPKIGKAAIEALDRAFEVYPLEALSAVEQTQIAIEHAVAEHLDDPFASPPHRVPHAEDVSLPKTLEALKRLAEQASTGDLASDREQLRARLAERPAAEQLIIGALLDPWVGNQLAKRLRKGQVLVDSIAGWFAHPETACALPWQTLSSELLSGAGQVHDRWSELAMRWQDALVNEDDDALVALARACAERAAG